MKDAILKLQALRDTKISKMGSNHKAITSLEDENKTLAGEVSGINLSIEELLRGQTQGPVLRFANLSLTEAILKILSGAKPPGLLTNEIIAELNAGGFKSEASDLYQSVYSVAMSLLKQDKIREGKKDEKRTFIGKAPF